MKCAEETICNSYIGLMLYQVELPQHLELGMRFELITLRLKKYLLHTPSAHILLMQEAGFEPAMLPFYI